MSLKQENDRKLKTIEISIYFIQLARVAIIIFEFIKPTGIITYKEIILFWCIIRISQIV